MDHDASALCGQSRRIGFIGLGTMGLPMAVNILRHGYCVTGYDVSGHACRSFAACGGRMADSVTELAGDSDIVITMLPSVPVIREVYLDGQGLLRGLRAGSVAIDMSTNDVPLTREISSALATAGHGFLDCPVGRTQQHAEKGTLLVLAGGDASTVEDHRELLMSMAEDVIYCGPSGMGQTIKLLNNLLANLITRADAEILTLGVKAGATVRQMQEVFMRTGAANNQLTGYLADKVLRGDTEAGFRIGLARKDQQLGLELARHLGMPLPMSADCAEFLDTAIGQGMAGRDMSYVLDLIASENNTCVRLD